jgi:hypothetical protein
MVCPLHSTSGQQTDCSRRAFSAANLSVNAAPVALQTAGIACRRPATHPSKPAIVLTHECPSLSPDSPKLSRIGTAVLTVPRSRQYHHVIAPSPGISCYQRSCEYIS